MLLLVLFVSAVVSAEIAFDTPMFPHSFKAVLDPNMILFWDKVGNEMSFEIHAKARGYVGIGISPAGGMTGADIALGWVKDGKGTLLDMYATTNGKPLLDAKQNLQLLHAEETNGITLLHFKRPLDTGDCQNDAAITSNSLRIIWAYSDQDPASNDDLVYHGTKKGVTRLQFLDNPDATRSVKLPNDLVPYDFLMPNVSIPKTVTTLYWCQVYRVPQLQKRHHMVKFARVLDNVAIAHHITGHSCYGNINVSLYSGGFDCFENMDSASFKCHESTFGWAVGGEEEFLLPEDVGIPIGGPNDARFFKLEIHYNNDEKKDWIDQSGMRMWLTPTLRKYDAGTFTVGTPVLPSQIIPPNAEFTTHSFCPEECLENALGAGKATEIRVYSYLLHSHLIGRKIRVRHIRKGEQIGWLGRDEWYDFNQQQTRIFTDHKVMLPGDQLIAECVYDSTARRTVTYGGHSTQEEMCLVFFQYYPKLSLSGCGSILFPEPQLKLFGDIKLNATWDVVKPDKYAGKPFQDMLNDVTWNPSVVSKLQEVQTNEVHFTYCVNIQGVTLIDNTTNYRRYPTFKKLQETSTCPVNAATQCWLAPIILALTMLASF